MKLPGRLTPISATSRAFIGRVSAPALPEPGAFRLSPIQQKNYKPFPRFCQAETIASRRLADSFTFLQLFRIGEVASMRHWCRLALAEIEVLAHRRPPSPERWKPSIPPLQGRCTVRAEVPASAAPLPEQKVEVGEHCRDVEFVVSGAAP